MKLSEIKKIIREEINDFLTDDRERADFRKIRGHIRLMLLNYRRDLEKLEDMRRASTRGDVESEDTVKIINELRPILQNLIRRIERYSND